MVVKFDLLAAADTNMGIGKNNRLPWHLKSEMAFFKRMTTETQDKTKKNVVLMGRKTWESIPSNFQPLPNRINFVMTRSSTNFDQFQDTYTFASLQEVIDKLEDDEFKNKYESVWVIGGSHIYKETMRSKYFHRLYLTTVLKCFDCDTFFPEMKNDLIKISDIRVPEEVQEENGIQFVYAVYENPSFNQ